jgi:hypothetical protein
MNSLPSFLAFVYFASWLYGALTSLEDVGLATPVPTFTILLAES